MIYGYARVSTAGQSKDGNSLEDQTKALQAYGCQEIITEAFSGKSMERPAFSMLFQKLQEGETLVVTKLDRFARTAIDGVSAVRDLYGTVINEGANSGILITTSDYGHDSYEFAKDKPLKLLNGGHLLALLHKNGRTAHINIEEAKKINEVNRT